MPVSIKVVRFRAFITQHHFTLPALSNQPDLHCTYFTISAFRLAGFSMNEYLDSRETFSHVFFNLLAEFVNKANGTTAGHHQVEIHIPFGTGPASPQIMKFHKLTGMLLYYFLD